MTNERSPQKTANVSPCDWYSVNFNSGSHQIDRALASVLPLYHLVVSRVIIPLGLSFSTATCARMVLVLDCRTRIKNSPLHAVERPICHVFFCSGTGSGQRTNLEFDFGAICCQAKGSITKILCHGPSFIAFHFKTLEIGALIRQMSILVFENAVEPGEN